MIMESLKQSVEDLRIQFKAQMAEFHQQLQKNSIPSSNSNTVPELAASFETFQSFVIKTLECLQSQVEFLTTAYEKQEMRSRRNMLLVHGIPEGEKEDTTKIVTKVISDNLKITNIDGDAISRCHRLGRSGGEKPRAIVVRFCDVRIRDNVWFAKTLLKKSGITLSEFLIKGRHEVFMAARQRYGVKQCWTREGSIFLLAPDGSRQRITCMADLDAIQISKDTSRAPPTLRPRRNQKAK